MKAAFSKAPAGMFVNAPCPMIVPYSDYLLGVLNSKIADWYIRHLGVTRNGGYFEYKPMFVEQLPVPVLTEETLKLFENKLNQTQTRENVDFIVSQLYGLTNQEYAFICKN